MRFFLRSKQFKVAVILVAAVLVLALAAWLVGGILSPQTNFVGAVAAPFQRAATAVSDFFRGYADRLRGADAVMLENVSLKEEVNRLTSELLDLEETRQQNEFYRNYLEIKEQNHDFQFEPAMLISRDAEDPFGGFVINKGSRDGVAAHDPVITDAGLVGYISEVGLTYAKVTTVLSPSLQAGGFDRRTRDAGVISGTLALAAEQKTRLHHLARTCSVAVGDYVVTAGGGVFPEGLLVGTIDAIEQESYNSSLFATLDPAVDFESLRDMMVITYFSGQGTAGQAEE